MSDLAHWQHQNSQYLGAALHWLRLHLLHKLASSSGDLAANLPDQGLMPQARRMTAEDLEQARMAMVDAAVMEPSPALVILSQRFGLSQFEQEVLLLCAALELDLGMTTLCTQLQAQLGQLQSNPSFGLALTLFDNPAWDAFSPERPLRYWQLVEVNQPGAQPLINSAIRADERIVNFLKGLNHLDDRLEPFLVPLDILSEAATLAPSQQRVVGDLLTYLTTQEIAPRAPVVQLLGPDSLSKQLVAWRTAATLGLQLYRLPVELLPTQASELETFTRLWQRESILMPLALYIDAQEGEGAAATEGGTPPLQRFLTRNASLCFLSTREIRPCLGRSTLAIDVAKPTPGEQQVAWTTMVGESLSDIPVRLAGQFNLNLSEIGEIARSSIGVGASSGETEPQGCEDLLSTRLWNACLMRTRPRLDTLAQRLDPKATWEDLVLPNKAMNLLQQVTQQVKQRTQVYQDWGFHRKMNRGMGISALFTGDSGTGKTMAAEVIANDLNLNLYRIDLSAVVSKYIGETEKNLRRLFDAAEDGGAILFFDEADALFGKRSEVKDSHDRYANIEINYLLQRMEAYRGLAILATNLKSALDRAFLRRLRFLIDFPFPGIEERRQIWQRAFPLETPTADLDNYHLSRFNLTGGSIHTIALNAAFMAAAAGTSVTMPMVLDAIRTEFDKLERPINEAEFRWPSIQDAARAQPPVLRP